MSENFKLVKFQPETDITELEHKGGSFNFAKIDMKYLTSDIYVDAENLALQSGRPVAVQGATFSRTTIKQGALRRKTTKIEEVKFPTIEIL